MWFCLFFICDYNVWNQVELFWLKREYFELEDRIIIMEDRLLGVFIFCRVFGDVQLKWSKELQCSVLERGFNIEVFNIYQFIFLYYYILFYLIVEFEVIYYRLRFQDKFFVLVLDGLWDMLSNEDVVRLVVGYLIEVDQYKIDLVQRFVNLGFMQSLLLQRKVSGFYEVD